MSRKSRDALAIMTPGPLHRLVPPAGITPAQAQLWAAIVDTKPAGWFDAGTAPLLAEYVRAVTMSDRLEEEIRTWSDRGFKPDLLVPILKARDAEAKRVASIGTKLRLTQQSRYTPQAASTATRRTMGAAGSRPWDRPA